MRLFLSWSGARSKLVAEHLRDWIPDLMSNVTTWMSSADINAGARWNSEIQKQLNATSFGVVCITRDNVASPWLLFECGALAKGIREGSVCPYLLDIEPSDLPLGPLSQFQAKRANEAETWELVASINNALDSGQEQEARLRRRFDTFWPRLARTLEDVPSMFEGQLGSLSSSKPEPNDTDAESNRLLFEVSTQMGALADTLPHLVDGISAVDARTSRLETTMTEIRTEIEDLKHTGSELFRPPNAEVQPNSPARREESRLSQLQAVGIARNRLGERSLWSMLFGTAGTLILGASFSLLVWVTAFKLSHPANSVYLKNVLLALLGLGAGASLVASARSRPTLLVATASCFYGSALSVILATQEFLPYYPKDAMLLLSYPVAILIGVVGGLFHGMVVWRSHLQRRSEFDIGLPSRGAAPLGTTLKRDGGE